MKRSWLNRRTPLKAKSRLNRTGGPKRGKRPGRASKAKRDAEWERTYGSEERVRKIQQTPSVVSGETPCENAHVRSGGMGRKADACWIVPLTWEEHQELHQFGHQTFENRHDVDLEAEARRIEALHPTRTP